MHDIRARPAIAATVLLCLLTIGVTALGFYDLMDNGPFAWHIVQPQFLQGGLELVLLAIGMVFAERLRDRRMGMVAILLLVALYARRHYIDYTIVLTALYVLGLYSIGVLAGRLTGFERNGNHLYVLLRTFLLGVVAFTLIVWSCALFLRVDFQQTKILTLIMLALAVLVSKPFKALSFKTGHTSWGLLFPSLCRAILVATLLAMLAKGNYKIGYDSAWYGLRPDSILFGTDGLFQYLGLSAQVYYYPKLYEVLIAPLVGNGGATGALGFSAFSWVFLLACTYLAAERLSIPRNWRWALLLAVGTLPAVAGMAVSAKGELFAAGLVLLCLACLQRHYRHRDLTSLLDCAAFALLASTVRLSMLPYLALIWVLFCVALLRWLPGRNFTESFRDHRHAWLTLLITTLAVVLVHYRTYVITGYPLLGTIGTTEIFRQLGFEPLLPNITFLDTSNAPPPDLIGLLVKYMISPSQLSMSTWTGALWAGLPLLAFIAMLTRRRWQPAVSVVAPLLMGIIFFVILATFHFPVPGGDGHFYMVPITALLLASAAILATDEDLWRGLPWAILLTALIQLTVSFMGVNWYTGTRIWDTKFGLGPSDDTRVHDTLRYHKLLPVAETIDACGPAARIIGLTPDPAGFMLPGRYESLQILTWANDHATNSPLAFSEYLQKTRIDMVVLPSTKAFDTDPRLSNLRPYRGIADKALAGIRLFAAQGQPVTVSKQGAYNVYSIGNGYSSGSAQCNKSSH